MVDAKFPPVADLDAYRESLEERDAVAPKGRRALSLHSVSSALRHGLCPHDRSFDRFMPVELQVVSDHFWTPLVVARRAAQWFDRLGIRSVVDIGSGAGKFCVAAALASDATFIGIEQREQLVDAARALARRFGVEDRVQFVHGTFGETPLPVVDAYYVFNPFEENLYPDGFLDSHIELSPRRYQQSLAAMTQLLSGAPVGSYLLTYNGFGGSVPPTYREVLVDRRLPNVLRMWSKASRKRSGGPCSADAP